MNWLRSLLRARPKQRQRVSAHPNRFRPLVDGLEVRCVPAVTLGTAANYDVLGLQNTAINNSNVTITGDEGVSQGGSLSNAAPSTIKGNAVVYSASQYSGPGKLGGGVVVNPGLLAQNDADALMAASQAAALTPTQTLGTVGSPTTVTGNGGLNVLAVNGDLTASLTLSGTASDIFVVNVTGTLTFTASSVLGLGGAVTADHVLYNFTGAGGTINSKVGNVFNGTLLAPNYSFNLDGTFNGEIIGGKSIVMLSGARRQPAAVQPALDDDLGVRLPGQRRGRLLRGGHRHAAAGRDRVAVQQHRPAGRHDGDRPVRQLPVHVAGGRHLHRRADGAAGRQLRDARLGHPHRGRRHHHHRQLRRRARRPRLLIGRHPGGSWTAAAGVTTYCSTPRTVNTSSGHTSSRAPACPPAPRNSTRSAPPRRTPTGARRSLLLGNIGCQ